jgi:hypothetical protein
MMTSVAWDVQDPAGAARQAGKPGLFNEFFVKNPG